VERIEHLVPTSDGGDDFVWVCGPGEGFWIVVGVRDEAVDGSFKVGDGSEDPAL
jgi:hypothetical protein